MSYKDVKAFPADLKLIYKAATDALVALDEMEAKWGGKYALGVKPWRVNWSGLSTMFKYPSKIRTLIYITNAIENFNRQLQKVTKTKKIKRHKEQDTKKVAVYKQEISTTPVFRIAYIDETGMDSYLYREHCYAKRGQTVIGQISEKSIEE